MANIGKVMKEEMKNHNKITREKSESLSNDLLDLDEADRYFTDTRGEKPRVNLGTSGGSMTDWEKKRSEFLSGVEWAKNKIFKI